MFDPNVLSHLESYLVKETHRKLDQIKIPYKELCMAPPEFDPEYLKDSNNFKKYQMFLQIKSAYTEPTAIILLYLFERKLGIPVKELYFFDLVGGTPPDIQGHSGRDIDYFIVVEKKIDQETIKKIEKYLDDLVGMAITDYYMKKGECYKVDPFNKIIKHNLVELHVITPEEKGKVDLNRNGTGIKADLEKYRKIIKQIETGEKVRGLVFSKKV
ncbi:MAG: hypothetical protein ACP6IP_00935 [Candidatus Njordarchaeia archaeon]